MAVDLALQEKDLHLAAAVFSHVADDMAMFLDRRLGFEVQGCSRSQAKVAGQKLIHINFKIGVRIQHEQLHGCLLMPLPEAISFACYLMMLPDETVAPRRDDTELDRSTKDAILEVGNLIGGSTDSALRRFHPTGVSARSVGCQGVRPGVCPAFPLLKGTDLVVARARGKLHTFPPFEAILMLPPIG